MVKKSIIILLLFICFICSLSAVSAHEGMENPIVDVDSVQPGDEVSQDVDLNVTVHQHNEIKYVNFTAEHIETRTKYLDEQDSNPSDGWSVRWDTSNAPNGEYWFTATAVDVKNLEGKAEMKLILNNIPKESYIVLENSTTSVNKSTNIVATMFDADSNVVSNKDLDFVIGAETYHAKTTSSGVASVSFTPKEVKNYEVIVKFNGDNKYSPSQVEGVVKVISNINATVVTVANVTGNNRERVVLKANLQAPGLYDANINKRIDFYVSGNFVGSALSDENGDAKFNYTISEAGGSYIYSAKYMDGNNESFVDYATLYVPESELYMTMNAVTYSVDGIFTVGNNFKLNLIVHNNGPDAAENTVWKYKVPASLKFVKASVSKGKLTFNSNSKLISWNIGDVEVGSQTAEITFQALSAAKNNLSSSLSTATFDKSVSNAAPVRYLTVNAYVLKASNLVKYYGGNDKFKVYLTTKDGKSVSGANIKILINKQTINLKTNSKGMVQLAINLKAGTYNIKVSCNKLSLSKRALIKPVLITKDLAAKQSKTTKFTAKALNANGKAAANKVVSFKFNGKKYSAKTNKYGVAYVLLKNLKVGKHVVVTSYGKSAVKNTITIKK